MKVHLAWRETAKFYQILIFDERAIQQLECHNFIVFCEKNSIATPIQPSEHALIGPNVSLAWQGHRQIISNFNLRLDINLIIGMPKFYWVLQENFYRNSDLAIGTVHGKPWTYRV